MRFRYYLRGAGVGILVTTVVLMIAFGQHKPTLTADEIIEEAEKLGMVMPDEMEENSDSSEGDESSEKSEIEEDTEQPVDDKAGENPEETPETPSGDTPVSNEQQNTEDTPATVPTAIAVTVEKGDVSRVVSERLFSLGLVDDAVAFDKYFCQTGKDNYMHSGTFYIVPGATYDEIISAITGGQ